MKRWRGVSIRYIFNKWKLDFKQDGVIKLLLGYCGCCRTYFVYPRVRRLNTAYVEDEFNYTRLCELCYEDAYDCYEELWQEYYSGRF